MAAPPEPRRKTAVKRAQTQPTIGQQNPAPTSSYAEQSAVEIPPKQTSSGVSSSPVPDPAAPAMGDGILRAGYYSDKASGADALSIGRDVEGLAYVIAAHDVEPPLSIGLFGDWGSGKSFFMNQLKKRVASLGARSLKEGAGSPFCARIIQIDFNAWHYIEANLWASLVIRVFEGLAAALSEINAGADQEERKLLAELKTRNAASIAAEARRVAAQQRLQTARDKQTQSLKNLTETIAQVPGQTAAIHRAAQAVEASLAGRPEDVTLQKFIDTGSSLNRSRVAVSAAWAQFRQWPVRRQVLAGALMAALLVGGVLAMVVFRNLQAGLLATALAVVGLLATFGPAAVLMFKAAGTLFDAVSSRDEVKKAWEAGVSATADVNVTSLKVAEAERELQLARSQAPAIYRFIQERYQSSDYRQDLGIVALIQRDFENLSKLLREPTGEGKPAQVDRIVLYVDDLDRCPPELVVKVLQAVHLLLAFPLFVVVVGVDSRWLVQSLQTINRGGSSIEFLAEQDDEQLPLNYLEKIFQIPYWIRPMDDIGYRQLIDSLALSSPRAGEDGGDDSDDAPADAPLTPDSLRIEQVERDYMKRLAPLIPTPRSAKRLVNTYRLLRATVGASGGEAFVGREDKAGEHRAVLMLLGIVTGYPQLAGDLFDKLAKSTDIDWPAFVDSLQPKTVEPDDPWPGLVDALGKVWVSPTQKPEKPEPRLAELEPYQRWAPAVARFSFQAGRVLAEAQRPGTQGTSPSRASDVAGANGEGPGRVAGRPSRSD